MHLGELSDLQSRTQPQFGIAVGASPFTYTATDPGTMTVQGGLVTALNVIRAGTSALVGVNRGSIRLQVGDQLQVSYNTWWPTLRFMKG